MQIFKRFCAIFISAMLFLSLAVPVLAAAPTGTITMKNTEGKIKTESSYAAYKVVAWNMSKIGNDVLYTDMVLTAAYRNALITTIGAPLTASSTDAEILTALSGVKDAAKMAALGVALSEVTRPADATAAAGVFSGLPYGYYLIIETENKANDGTVLSKPILVSLPDEKMGSADLSVTVKTSKADIEKKIMRGEEPVKAAEVPMGGLVDFKLSATIPTYAANAKDIVYYVTDTLSKGLTLKDEGLSVTTAAGTLLTKDVDYTVTRSTNTAGETTMKLNFVYNNIKTAGTLTIRYQATVNEKAAIGSAGNPNSVTLTYSNNPGGGTSYTTPKKQTLVFNTGLRLTKVDSNNASLAGATFGIYSDAKCEVPVGFYTYKIVTDETGTHVSTELMPGTEGKIVTVSDGIAYFAGLVAGDYYIKELTAPAGYDLLKEVIHVTIGVTLPQEITLGTETAQWTISGNQFTENSGVFDAKIVNTKGFQLPGTGGMGTTIFVVVGSSLLLLACGLSFFYFKKNRA